jgi:hypothetical protein
MVRRVNAGGRAGMCCPAAMRDVPTRRPLAEALNAALSLPHSLIKTTTGDNARAGEGDAS